MNKQELLNADYNLKSWLDILYGQDERDWEQIQKIEKLLNKLNFNKMTKRDWAEIQELCIAREIMREQAMRDWEQHCFTEADNNKF